MPRSAKYPCRKAGCRALLDKPGFCDAHRCESFKKQKQVVTVDYKERNRFYQRKAWKNARALQLSVEPLCRHCRAAGKLTEANVVDHIVSIESGGATLDPANLQSLCKPCHDSKTRVDGGRGGAVKSPQP